jgi:hypothetical protein
VFCGILLYTHSTNNCVWGQEKSIDTAGAENYVPLLWRDVGTNDEREMTALTAQLAEQFARGKELQQRIQENLKRTSYDF